MCNFASFVLTKDAVHYSDTDSHEDIIARHGLHTDGARGPNVLRVEITPPETDPKAPLDEWVFRIDQDDAPEWCKVFCDPTAKAEAERRTREALTERAAKERWLVTETVGAGESCICGYAGTATAGDEGTATAGTWGTVIVRYWDSAAERYRLAVGYVGEDGIEPGKPYRWDADKGRVVGELPS